MTQHSRFAVLLGALLIAAAHALGCGSAAVEAAAQQGSLVLEYRGAEVTLPADQMEVLLVDPDWEDEYPETFRLYGDAFDLVGRFPLDRRVGYEVDWSPLLDTEVTIEPSLDDGRETFRSAIRAEGLEAEVRSGTLTVRRVLGPNPDGAGYVVEGTVSLMLDDGRMAGGRFVVLAKTWG